MKSWGKLGFFENITESKSDLNGSAITNVFARSPKIILVTAGKTKLL